MQKSGQDALHKSGGDNLQRGANIPKHVRLVIYSYLDLRDVIRLRGLCAYEKESLASS